jgi:3-deoxy-7-phosphoheptulonate synthase
MKKGAHREAVAKVIGVVEKAGLVPHVVIGEDKTIIGVIGDKTRLVDVPLVVFDGVEKVLQIAVGYKRVSREFTGGTHAVQVGGITIGDGSVVVMAGPCAVESMEQLMQSAWAVKKGGAQFLRGGAFKPRTSPYSFKGLEEAGLEMLSEARKETGLKVVTEVMDVENVDLVCKHSDMLQIGTRNMQNFHLLKAVGRTNKPVLLKRGLAATIDEWLNAAEYIAAEGNREIVLCERGIRTFETYTRNTLDLSAIVATKTLSNLPIIVDPSHGTGIRNMVKPMSLAAVAAGADGLMIEVHPNPENALSDGPQSLNPEEFDDLMRDVTKIAAFRRESLEERLQPCER